MRCFCARSTWLRYSTPDSKDAVSSGTAPPCTRLSRRRPARTFRSRRMVSLATSNSVASEATSTRPRVRANSTILLWRVSESTDVTLVGCGEDRLDLLGRGGRPQPGDVVGLEEHLRDLGQQRHVILTGAGDSDHELGRLAVPVDRLRVAHERQPGAPD